jgi:hypothetical protein
MAKKTSVKGTKKSRRKTVIDLPAKAPKDFDLLKAIRKEPDYKTNVLRRDKSSRKYIAENVPAGNKLDIMEGQLIMFDYLEPATKDELEYYDARPCTIFFAGVPTAKGYRVLGFNIHYYPPRIRFQVMNRIYEIFKPIYAASFNKAMDKDVAYFNYKMLISQLQKAKLDFGIRMYIPKLMTNIVPVPAGAWSKAVLTEGHFKKETRAQILSYWKNKSDGITKPQPKGKGKGGKKTK